MKKCLILLLLIALHISFAQPKPPYPIIFVHGLAGGSDETFVKEILNSENRGNV